MRLVFIYGIAAAGKLTVAKELAQITGYPLFHNHLIVNAVVSTFPFGSPTFVKLRHEFWLRVFEEAAAEQRSLIFTFTPEPTVPDSFVPEVIETWTSRGGRIDFVHLHISLEEQERRIESPDRVANGKLSSRETLRQIRSQPAPILPYIPSDLKIDTENSTPKESAQRIRTALELEFEGFYRPFQL